MLLSLTSVSSSFMTTSPENSPEILTLKSSKTEEKGLIVGENREVGEYGTNGPRMDEEFVSMYLGSIICEERRGRVFGGWEIDEGSWRGSEED
jgi:hypothetical protein